MSDPKWRLVAEQLAVEYAKLADMHHRTVVGSRLHDPLKREFWDCQCLTCKKATKVLRANGYSPEGIIVTDGT